MYYEKNILMHEIYFILFFKKYFVMKKNIAKVLLLTLITMIGFSLNANAAETSKYDKTQELTTWGYVNLWNNDVMVYFANNIVGSFTSTEVKSFNWQIPTWYNLEKAVFIKMWLTDKWNPVALKQWDVKVNLNLRNWFDTNSVVLFEDENGQIKPLTSENKTESIKVMESIEKVNWIFAFNVIDLWSGNSSLSNTNTTTSSTNPTSTNVNPINNWVNVNGNNNVGNVSPLNNSMTSSWVVNWTWMVDGKWVEWVKDFQWKSNGSENTILFIILGLIVSVWYFYASKNNWLRQ